MPLLGRRNVDPCLLNKFYSPCESQEWSFRKVNWRCVPILPLELLFDTGLAGPMCGARYARADERAITLHALRITKCCLRYPDFIRSANLDASAHQHRG